MSIIYAIILGLIQGFTEFLPVSSSGHLVLLNKLFQINNNFLFLSIILHVATLLAVFIVFWKDIVLIVKNPLGSYSRKILLSFIPTVIIVLLFKSFIENAFAGKHVSICFMITAFLLLACDFFAKESVKKNDYAREVSYRSSFIIGIAQGIAVIPGISRSGATICTGLLLGEKREVTARFSFLMSIPVIIASFLYEILFSKNISVFFYEDIIPTIVGFTVALLVGIISIKIMLKVVEKAGYIWFAIYLLILGFVSFIWF